MKIIRNTDGIIFISKVAGAIKANKITGTIPRTTAELAKLTGNKPSTIKAFFYNGTGSENLYKCIAKVMGIER